MLALMPVVVRGMEMVPAHGVPVATLSTFSTFSVMCSVVWYYAGYTAIGSVAKAVPEVVDVAVTGVEEVVEDMVYGTKAVIRRLSIGVVIIAAMTVVRTSYLFYIWLGEKLGSVGESRALKDSYLQKYGGRLLGGAKIGRAHV